MSWAATIGAVGAIGGAALSRNTGGTTTSAQSGQLNPYMYSSLYGAGAVQPVYTKKGRVKNQAEIDAANAARAASGGGLMGQAEQLSQQPAMNPLQTQALQQSANYLASPQALQGYNALNSAGGNLMGFQNPVNLSGMSQVSQPGAMPTSTAASAGSLAGSAPQASAAQAQLAQGNAPMVGGSSVSVFNPNSIPQVQAAQGQLANFQPGGPIDWLGIQKAIGQTFQPAGVGGGVGGVGVNWQDAATKAMSGQADNPYLTQMAKGGADVATENYLRNVAPAQRAGARMSGMYGGSRQGIAEGLAQSDLNNQILRASTDLFGNAYESAQQRAAAMSGQMAGLDTQRAISNAQLGLQGSIANQDAALRAGQLGLSTAQGLANYDLGRQGIGLDAASLAQQGGLANAGMLNQVGLGNQDAYLRGAGLAQEGSQFNANLGQNANLANQRAGIDWAGLQQQGNLANAGFQQQANLANQSAGLDWAGLGQQRDLANAGFQQQSNLANQSAGIDWAKLGQQGQIANQDSFLRGQGLNLQGAGLAGEMQARGAGMLQDASQVPYANLANLYGIGSIQQQAPWDQLGRYSGLLQPYSGMGSSQSTSTTTPGITGAQTAGGLLNIGAGILGNMNFGGSPAPWTTKQVDDAMRGIGTVRFT
jgi:hypothetical protein